MTDNVINLPVTPEQAIPEDPDGELVAVVLSKLMQESDTLKRLQVVAALDGTRAGLAGRLGWVRRVSVAQLHAEGKSYAEIGKAMGVSKERAFQISQDGHAVDDPTYAWGRLLSTVQALARLADQAGRRDDAGAGKKLGNYEWGEANKLVTIGLASTAVRPRIIEATRRYAKVVTNRAQLDRTKRIAEELLARTEELVVESESLPNGAMTLDQRAQVALGLHHERAERNRLVLDPSEPKT